MNEVLYDIVLEKILADSTLDEAVGDVVLAACEGDEQFQALLDGHARSQRSRLPSVDTGERPGVALASITVEGFRGIGPRVTLPLKPGPGLTLVVGRNGSGKSSFSEALELLLTGANQRWATRSSVWSDGWRNLHHPARCSVSAEFVVEGRSGPMSISRTWQPEQQLADATTVVQPHGQPKMSLPDLRWGEAIQNYRPFLSYNELGTMLDKGPSVLYDRLSAILGLEDLSQADARLRQARRVREEGSKKATELLKDRILPLLNSIPDERAIACTKALSRRPWKLSEVDAILAGEPVVGQAGNKLPLLHQLKAVRAPEAESVSTAIVRLRAASEALRQLSGTPADHARKLASLLEQALDLHANHGDADCPVCGRSGALDEGWRNDSEREVRRLREIALQSDDAHHHSRESLRQARGLVAASASPLEGAENVGVDVTAAREALLEWCRGIDHETPDLLAEHLERQYAPLSRALEVVRMAALAELQRYESEWNPVAIELSAWVKLQRAAETSASVAERLKQADKWLKDATAAIRDERFAPIGDVARTHWDTLRQNSNVELGRVELSGQGTQRRVVLDVTVDGVAGAALGVMSQGELNSLALSLFMPRATLPESPFRFLVIDDPVQSMDSARVDGLARVLDQTARSRQVIVLSHDSRLSESVRRLGINANVIELTQRPGSVVELRTVLDPARRALSDAHALIMTDNLDPALAARVVPGFCRAALEAVFSEVVRRRLLERGERHDDVEAKLLAADTLNKLAALALFDDQGRTADVRGRLSKMGKEMEEAYCACNRGTHQGYDGDLLLLQQDVTRLVASLGK